MVLGGKLNKELVRLVAKLGGCAVGLTGKDGGLVKARRIVNPDRGLVGEVTSVDPTVIEALAPTFIPIIAPIAPGEKAETLNINADPFAAALAATLGAAKLVLLTDVAGVAGADGELIGSLAGEEIVNLVRAGVVTGGNDPKARECQSSARCRRRQGSHHRRSG